MEISTRRFNVFIKAKDWIPVGTVRAKSVKVACEKAIIMYPGKKIKLSH